ncbi:PepSY1/2 domain-containing protein [Clostridium sp.]|uniref:PepSY1/2 domain-containing protein n=1 Tax=Clostridium sp. TaxID=1506 RepID=UPI002850A5E6|nr:PepSY1/2 domain-containing protein [Clostridium sp.]MDR3596953.1 S-layer homology domain-containing protein [Clostridium sp.]
MKKKRIINLAVVVCLILSTFSFPAFGAEEDSKGLEQAIVVAKNIITVPDNYTEFTNSSNERETSNGKVKVWGLNWKEKDEKSGCVSASVGEDGFLYEYNKYYYDEETTSGLAQVTKDKAQVLAEEFLKKAIPNYSGQMKKVDNNSDMYSNQEYNFTYQRFLNEVPVDFINVSIGVNKYTGEITYFNGGNPETKGIEYPALDGIVESSVAEKAYIEKLGVNLKYYSYYDYNKKKMNIFAGYSIDENKYNAIDAKTEQVTSLYHEDSIYNNKDYTVGGKNNVAIATTSDELTKEETDEVNNVANLITKEKAENILRDTFDIITSDMKIKDVSLNKRDIDDKYVWNLSFDNVYGKVDAKSGEIISMHYYRNDNVNNNSISKIEGQNIAESFLKKNAPNKFLQTKYKEIKRPELKINTDKEENTSVFNFVRQANGMEFSSNLLQVEVDNTNGKIIGYSNNWYDNISFPDITQAMSKDAAFEKIKQLSDFTLQYAKLDKNKVGLVYNFKDINEDYIIDPINGVRLDFSGEIYKENKIPEYTDINGHWCEKTVKELLDNGYYIDGDKFNPNMNITQINFFKYLYSPEKNNYKSDDEFYDMLIEKGVIKKEEKNPNSLVSNGDAAKFVIRYLGCEKIAGHPEIFNNPFNDNMEEKYRGYAAMCYALNIIKGVDGNFNSSNNINNAEAAAIIYNLLNVEKQ